MKKFKILIVGEINSGKTSILTRFQLNKYNEKTTSTVGVDFKSIQYKIQGKEYTFEIYDCSGCEQFKEHITQLIEQIDIVIICYDITNEDCLKQVQQWKQFISRRLKITPNILVGNKCDLLQCQASLEIKKWYHLDTLYHTSAKTGANVQQLFNDVFILAIKQNKTKSSLLKFEKRVIDEKIKETKGFFSFCCSE